ncbi:uncharacterized protein [Diadema antillarum]|uniref:uncharacterized protein n=1 Tax=Diadema antillarum TaxID=105358 RepID=UPI003A8A13FF
MELESTNTTEEATGCPSPTLVTTGQEVGAPVLEAETPTQQTESMDGTAPAKDTPIVEEESKSIVYQVKTVSAITTTSSQTPVFTLTNEEGKTKFEPTAVVSDRVTISTTSQDEPVCRICHDTEDDKGRKKLVSPCGCTGSAEFTHKRCLQKWTNVKGATSCEICNQTYKPKYMRFRQKLLTRQVMCMGSAASLPLLIVIIVGFFLLGEQLSMGSYGDDDKASGDAAGDMNEDGSSVSKIMVSVCMIATATFGIFLLCCFSVWAAKAQPQHVDGFDRGPFLRREQDVEHGRDGGSPQQRVPVPLFFF